MLSQIDMHPKKLDTFGVHIFMGKKYIYSPEKVLTKLTRDKKGAFLYKIADLLISFCFYRRKVDVPSASGIG